MDEMTAPDQGPMFADELPADHRSGFVALIGKPNVGKSTLLNAWLGARLAAVSPKPQTTRTSLLGILTRPDAQVVFVDTPGIHRPRTKLGEQMVQTAKHAIPDADLVLFVVDLSSPPTRADQEIAALLQGPNAGRTVLVMNKVDLAPLDQVAELRDAYQALGEFSAALAVSALEGHNLDELLEHIVARLPEGPRFYPDDQLSDQQERFIAAEIIREYMLRTLEKEVPHASAVLVQDFKERENGVLYISATIYTERDSQKGIVIGRGGAMLKRIGREARVALEEIWGRRVYLELWVKVRKNWRRSERDLKQLGYGPS